MRHCIVIPYLVACHVPALSGPPSIFLRPLLVSLPYLVACHVHAPSGSPSTIPCPVRVSLPYPSAYDVHALSKSPLPPRPRLCPLPYLVACHVHALSEPPVSFPSPFFLLVPPSQHMPAGNRVYPCSGCLDVRNEVRCTRILISPGA